MKEARLKTLHAVDSVHPGKGKIMGKITDWSLPKDWGLGEVLTEIIRVFWGMLKNAVKLKSINSPNNCFYSNIGKNKQAGRRKFPLFFCLPVFL